VLSLFILELIMKRFLSQCTVLLLLALASSSCVNRNITYVTIPSASQLVTDRTKSGEPLTAKIVVSGTTEIVPTETPDPKIVKTPPITPPDDIGPQKGFCPLYRLPTLPPAPAAPLDKLAALKPTDTAAIDALTRNHIEDLHHYIIQTQAILAKSYKDYIANCERLRHKPKPKM
jgi:ABC-type Fe3+-hydroxamate transport system substrate-binding protein